MFELIGDNGLYGSFDTKEAAIAAARKVNSEAFEVRDDDDFQVYCEFPQPTWV